MFKRLMTIPLIILACGWSHFSYLLFGWPKDKLAYKAHYWGWLAEGMQVHWEDLDKAFSFHELKNVGVEYCRAHAQVAMKSLCMFLVLGWLGCFIFGLLSLVLFLV